MSTMILLIAAIAGILVVIGMLLRGILRHSAEPLPDASWLESFDASRYRPMQRLLSEEDYGFLAESGTSAAVIAQLRAERRRIFRAYLRNIVRDFNRLHRAARILSLQAETDRSDFAMELVRMKLQFAWSVQTVEFRLLLHSLGLANVDARQLIRTLDRMSAGYSSLAPAAQPAAA